MTRLRSIVLLVALGVVAASLPWTGGWADARPPYEDGYWLAGDAHIHTMFSPDGMYPIEEQVAQAVRHGLGWCVITDHGGPHHDRAAIAQAYPALQLARARHPEIVVYQGLEWNIPAAEHGGVILPVEKKEAQVIADFEARFDPVNESRLRRPGKQEEDAVAGLRYLESLGSKPLFFAHHPARRGLDSPAEMRAWSDAAPHVARGMEGAPGHQASTLAGSARGAYQLRKTPESYPAFPPEAYVTHGGFDWFVSRVGGLWDSLLSEGRPWFITANSDSHRHYSERREVDSSTYRTLGHTTVLERTGPAGGYDFWPGEYTKTIVYTRRRDPASIMSALRAGSMFVVHGDLLDRLEVSASSGKPTARMGETLWVRPGTSAVAVTVRFHSPPGLNAAGRRPVPHHFDLITGPLSRGPVDRSSQEAPATRVAATFAADAWMAAGGGWYEVRAMLPIPEAGAYLRVRGTNRPSSAPQPDAPTVNPWDDLWFYSNPIFVQPQRVHATRAQRSLISLRSDLEAGRRARGSAGRRSATGWSVQASPRDQR